MSNPYESSTPSPTENPMQKDAPPKKGRNCLVISLVTIGVLILLCGGCAFGSYFFLGDWFTSKMGESVQFQFEDHPVIVEKIGTIESNKYSIKELASYMEAHPEAQGKSLLALRLVGDKGEGTLIGEVAPGGGQELTNMILIQDGEEFPLE